jgi:hypothetical protein
VCHQVTLSVSKFLICVFAASCKHRSAKFHVQYASSITDTFLSGRGPKTLKLPYQKHNSNFTTYNRQISSYRIKVT